MFSVRWSVLSFSSRVRCICSRAPTAVTEVCHRNLPKPCGKVGRESSRPFRQVGRRFRDRSDRSVEPVRAPFLVIGIDRSQTSLARYRVSSVPPGALLLRVCGWCPHPGTGSQRSQRLPQRTPDRASARPLSVSAESKGRGRSECCRRFGYASFDTSVGPSSSGQIRVDRIQPHKTERAAQGEFHVAYTELQPTVGARWDRILEGEIRSTTSGGCSGNC